MKKIILVLSVIFLVTGNLLAAGGGGGEGGGGSSGSGSSGGQTGADDGPSKLRTNYTRAVSAIKSAKYFEKKVNWKKQKKSI